MSSLTVELLVFGIIVLRGRRWVVYIAAGTNSERADGRVGRMGMFLVDSGRGNERVLYEQYHAPRSTSKRRFITIERSQSSLLVVWDRISQGRHGIHGRGWSGVAALLTT